MSYKIVDYPLTSLGAQQAEYLAGWLKDHQIAGIYTSPLKRALETAEIIAKRLEIAKITVMEELREVNVGLLDGLKDRESWDIHDGIIRRWASGDHSAMFEGGEDSLSLQYRFKVAVHQILADNAYLGKNQGIAVVAHGGIFSFGLPGLCNNIEMDLSRLGLKNTAVTIVEAEDGQLNCTHWGITEHLSLT